MEAEKNPERKSQVDMAISRLGEEIDNVEKEVQILATRLESVLMPITQAPDNGQDDKLKGRDDQVKLANILFNKSQQLSRIVIFLKNEITRVEL